MQTWSIHKPEVESRSGIVAAQHFEAAQAGAKVLAAGGNAMDAAVVTALVLSTVEPWLSGIGGGGFLLHADGASGRVDALDFSVRAPCGLDPADYRLAGGRDGDWFDWPAVTGDRNIFGYPSICVPGTIAGLAAALERFGTLSWKDALEPGIAVAERGLEVDWYTALCIAIDSSGLSAFPASAEIFLEDGRPPRTPAGTAKVYRPMPAKAALLRRLADSGPGDFYHGETARQLVADLAEGGSRISAADLAGYQPRWAPPLKAEYRGWGVCANAGLSGGPSLLATLRLLESALPRGRQPDAKAALAYARAIREAYRVRLTGMGHAAREGDCTSHISVVDAQGNMVSLTNTLLSRFGSKVVLPRSGILMNNGMMWFDPRPGVPNAIAPGAQPLANMCPLILTRDGLPAMAIGAAGGRQIFPALAQIVSYMVDFGMSLEEAFHAPRLDASTPTIKVNRTAAPDVASTVAAEFPVELVLDTLYPVNFAVPSAVTRDARSGINRGMAHPTNPWAVAVAGDG